MPPAADDRSSMQLDEVPHVLGDDSPPIVGGSSQKFGI